MAHKTVSNNWLHFFLQVSLSLMFPVYFLVFLLISKIIIIDMLKLREDL